jgi:hypothetical protein
MAGNLTVLQKLLDVILKTTGLRRIAGENDILEGNGHKGGLTLMMHRLRRR